MGRENISASELSEFVFCRRAWWLKYQMGATNDAAGKLAERAGESWHRREQGRVAKVVGIELVGAGLLLFGVLLLTFHLLGWAR